MDRFGSASTDAINVQGLIKMFASFCVKRNVCFGVGLFVVFFVCFLICTTILRGEESVVDNSLRISRVDVGVSGVYKNGYWTKVLVGWRNGKVKSVELETTDSDGTPFFSRYDVNMEEQEAGILERGFTFPKSNGKLSVRLISDSQSIVEEVFEPGAKSKDDRITFNAPATSKPVYVVVGDEKLGFSEAFAELRWKEERRPSIVKVNKISELPLDSRAFESIDKLFLTTNDPDVFENVGCDNKRMRAIYEWVEHGGSVVLIAGAKSPELLKEGAALYDLAPGRQVAAKPHEFRSVNSFVSELRNVKNLAMTGARSNPYLQTPVVSELKSDVVVEMQEAETPLLTVQPVGLGTVVYFAADLSTAPISNWSGRGRLLLKILGVDPDKANVVSDTSLFVKRGYSDWSGQLRSALDSFDGVKVVSFSLIATFLFVYLLAIAPVDWIVAKKLIKRPVVTWITFPLSVAVFSAVAVLIVKSSTPKTPVLNQAEVLDVDLESGIARDTTWIGFYTPYGNRYDFETSTILPKSEDVCSTLIPLPLSGEGLGGAEQKNYLPGVWNEPYFVGSDAKKVGVRRTPIASRSSKSFVGRSVVQIRDLPKSPRLVDDGLTLKGTIVNPFDVPMYSAYILYDGGAYSLGTLAPGETPIEQGATRIEPMRVLNEHRSSVPASQTATWDSTVYNCVSTRIPYILRTASFYEFGGGEDNFGIAKRLQGDVDLSALLRCGRAVVYGTIVDPYYAEYRSSNELAKKSADALELENLNKKVASSQGKTSKSLREETVERYGEAGSSDDFFSTLISWKGSDMKSTTQRANKRTVVARIVVPLERNEIKR